MMGYAMQCACGQEMCYSVTTGPKYFNGLSYFTTSQRSNGEIFEEDHSNGCFMNVPELYEYSGMHGWLVGSPGGSKHCISVRNALCCRT